ncbi:hypothetical protein FHS77_003210 [Paenochrobactrum gallinarii]|uniref:Uncharacterized protein n=1 Tax=Paenochrobactrum gallinarii TaxID=643673 RepID=A0A841M925_9HYPH|nr:hypothetical protein [Paenochrobactrum gallinarii]
MTENQTSFSPVMTHASVIHNLSVMEKPNEINSYDAYDTYDACFDPQFERVCRR